jgi:hypothetical protein
MTFPLDEFERLEDELEAEEAKRAYFINRQLSKKQKQAFRALNDRIRIIRQRLTQLEQQWAASRPKLSERQKMDDTLKEAVDRELVFVEESGDPNAERRCVLLGSAHYPTHDIKHVPFMMQWGQYQLFAFLEIAHRNTVNRTLYVEGTQRGMQPITRVNVTMLDKSIKEIHTPDAQGFFAKHANEFIAMQHDLFQKGRRTSFFEFSTYPLIEGAHGPETWKLLDDISPLMPHGNRFLEKYKPAPGASEQVKAELRDGRFAIFIKNQWVSPDELHVDCVRYIEYCDAMDICSTAREEEVVNLFASGDPEYAPMAWVGLSHVQPIVEQCVARGMFVQAVIPKSHTLDQRQWANERSTAVLLRDFAAANIEKNRQLGQ